MAAVASKLILTQCFDHLVEFGADKLVVIIGYKKQNIISKYGNGFERFQSRPYIKITVEGD
mgnify:CR=1 FL=1